MVWWFMMIGILRTERGSAAEMSVAGRILSSSTADIGANSSEGCGCAYFLTICSLELGNQFFNRRLDWLERAGGIHSNSGSVGIPWNRNYPNELLMYHEMCKRKYHLVRVI